MSMAQVPALLGTSCTISGDVKASRGEHPDQAEKAKERALALFLKITKVLH